MTAPRCVELNKHVLLVVKYDLFVVVRNDDRNRSFLLLGNRLGLYTRLHLAINVLLDELAKVLLGDLCSSEGKFLVLDGVLNSERRPLSNLEVQITSVRAKGFCINGRKIDLTLVLLCNGFDLCSELGALLRGLREKVRQWNSRLVNVVSCRMKEEDRLWTHSHVGSVGLGPDFANKRCTRSFRKVCDGFDVEFLFERVLALIKVLVEYDAGLLYTFRFGQCGVAACSEQIVISHRFGDVIKGSVGNFIIRGEIGDNDNFIRSLELFNSFRGDGRDGREGLFSHVRDDTIHSKSVCCVAIKTEAMRTLVPCGRRSKV